MNWAKICDLAQRLPFGQYNSYCASTHRNTIWRFIDCFVVSLPCTCDPSQLPTPKQLEQVGNFDDAHRPTKIPCDSKHLNPEEVDQELLSRWDALHYARSWSTTTRTTESEKISIPCPLYLFSISLPSLWESTETFYHF